MAIVQYLGKHKHSENLATILLLLLTVLNSRVSNYSRRQIKGNNAFLCNISVKHLWIVLIDKFCKLTHFLWSCRAVIEGFLLIWILIILSCQSVTILFLVSVPWSLSLGTAKSLEAAIPHELKLKNLQIADFLKPIFLPISAIIWFALGYAKICTLWVSVSWTIVINKIKCVYTKNYRSEQQNSNPYRDMGILGINIFS